MRLVQIGVGSWGATWARVAAESPAAELVALVDRDPTALGRLDDSVGVPGERRFVSLEEALKRVQADAALVVVPPADHAEVVAATLEAGLHCLVEKPFALTSADAADAVRRADETGRTLMVNQDHRHTRGARTVQRLLTAGAIGGVNTIRIRFSQTGEPRPYQPDLAEPLLVDMAIHQFDLLRAFGVEPDRVSARSFNPPWSHLPRSASADALLDARRSDTFVAYSGTLAARGRHTSWSGEWELHGEDGTLVWDGDRIELFPAAERPALRRLRRVLGRRVSLDPVPAQGRAGSLAEFAAAVEANREPETSGADNLRTLALALAAAESAAAGGAAIEVAADAEPW